MTYRSKALAVVWSVLVATSLLGATAAFAGPVAAQSSSQADVVFVFDKTGSMNEEAAALKDEVENAAAELDSSGVDARYGLITYESDTNTEIRLDFTNDTQALKDELEFGTGGGTEDASDAILLALNNMSWRSDAKKIVVVITDEDDDSPAETRQKAIQQLNEQNACLLVVAGQETINDNDLRKMAQDAECGSWTDIGSDTETFTNAVKDVIDTIKEVAPPVEEVAPTVVGANPDFEVVEKSTDKSTVYTHETFNASVVVENTGSGDGSYHALITDSGRVIHSEHVSIPAGNQKTVTTEASYPNTGEYRVTINYRTLGYVKVVDRPLQDDEINVTGGEVPRSTVGTGESYTVTATVENVGPYPGYATVPFASGDNGTNSTSSVASRTVQLDPGESKTVSYEATAPEDAAGSELTWTADGQRLGNVSVEGFEESGVVEAYANASSVAPGDAYDVTAVVYNPGDESNVFTVTIGNESGSANAFRLVEVGPGESVHATWTKEAPADAGQGTATWWFNGEAASVDVAIVP